jgi:hypothetical protein
MQQCFQSPGFQSVFSFSELLERVTVSGHCIVHTWYPPSRWRMMQALAKSMSQ